MNSLNCSVTAIYLSPFSSSNFKLDISFFIYIIYVYCDFFSVSSIDDFKLVLINLTEFPLAGTILLTIPSVVVFLLIYYNPLVSYFFMLFVSLVVSSMNKYISFFKSSTSLATSMNYSLRTFLRFS